MRVILRFVANCTCHGHLKFHNSLSSNRNIMSYDHATLWLAMQLSTQQNSWKVSTYRFLQPLTIKSPTQCVRMYRFFLSLTIKSCIVSTCRFFLSLTMKSDLAAHSLVTLKQRMKSSRPIKQRICKVVNHGFYKITKSMRKKVAWGVSHCTTTACPPRACPIPMPHAPSRAPRLLLHLNPTKSDRSIQAYTQVLATLVVRWTYSFDCRLEFSFEKIFTKSYLHPLYCPDQEQRCWYFCFTSYVYSSSLWHLHPFCPPRSTAFLLRP